MFRFMLVSACVAIVASQQQYHQNPQTAAIISEQRYQTGDGQFGAAYTQEDGTDFKEETDADGTRHGSYSYIDPTGQKRTISYTAGKNGFQASGDHLPVAPPAPAHAAPQQQPQQQYRSQAAPQQYQQQPQQYNSDSSDQFDDGQYDPRHNDPSFSTGNNNNHFVAAPTHAPAAPAPQQQHYQQPQPQYNQPQPQYNQPQPQYNPQPNYNHVPQYTTTQNPHRFQPPGKLSLNRTPDGYSYSFNKV